MAAVEREVVVTNPASDLWRAVRQREAPMAGRTQVNDPANGQLINQTGQDWRSLRRDRLIPYGAWALAAVATVVGLLVLLTTPTPIPGGESKLLVKRLDLTKRVAHWSMAVLVFVLAATGLTLLFGRFIFLPWMGSDAFGAIAAVAKFIHDWTGPLFIATLVMFFAHYVRKNLPERGDLGWLLRLGGLIGKKHLSVGFFNAGEKTLFWLVVVVGLVLSGSGLVIWFPNLVPNREILQITLVVHSIATLGLVAMVAGHIYMVSAVKGTLPAITTGHVDANWARHHHERWYEECEAEGKILNESSAAAPASERRPSMDEAVAPHT